MDKIIILQTVLPDYRKTFFSYLNEVLEGRLELFGGDKSFQESIRTDPTITFFREINNLYFFNRSVLFQFGMWHTVFKNNVLVLELNPRIISNWIILLLRFWLPNKTVLWGHAWPRRGPKARSELIRNVMRILADEIIVYTKTQKMELQAKMPFKSIKAASNSIYLRNQMVPNLNIDFIKNVIYVGRLTKNKKPMLLVESFHLALNNLPDNANLLIVGDGDERKTIEEYIQRNYLEPRIKLLGHIVRYEELQKLFDTSLVSVSPGYAGLSVTLSFGFGVPIIISQKEDHSPEIEAVKIDNNSAYFKTDSTSSLSKTIIKFYQEKDKWIDKRAEISNYCKENYSVEIMAESFLN